MRLRLAVLLALLATFCSQARANYSNPAIDCNPAGGGSTQTTATCATSLTTGTLEIVIVNAYQYTSASIADNGGNTWHSATAAHIGTSAGYQTYIFYSTITSSGGITITVTFSPSATATYYSAWFLESTGGSPASDALDQAAGNTFTSTASSQSTSNVTLLANDLIVTSIVCNSGTTSEFSVTGPLTSLGGSGNNSFQAAYNNSVSAGSQHVTWNGSNNGPCTFSGGTYGVIAMAAFAVGTTSADTQIGGFAVGPMKGKPNYWQLYRILPWNRPRRIVEMEKISRT